METSNKKKSTKLNKSVFKNIIKESIKELIKEGAFNFVFKEINQASSATLGERLNEGIAGRKKTTKSSSALSSPSSSSSLLKEYFYQEVQEEEDDDDDFDTDVQKSKRQQQTSADKQRLAYMESIVKQTASGAKFASPLLMEEIVADTLMTTYQRQNSKTQSVSPEQEAAETSALEQLSPDGDISHWAKIAALSEKKK